jgi:hypothetical protein
MLTSVTGESPAQGGLDFRADRGDIVVEGKESIHWACYDDAGTRTLYLVDTDWTEEGSGSDCLVQWDGGKRSQSVTVTHAGVSVVEVS